MSKGKISDLLIFVVAAELIGALSSLVSGDWGFYSALIQPPFAPPGWVFPVVWIILYALMGVSAWLIYSSGDTESTRSALTAYWVQLAVNFVWSIVFFRYYMLGAAAAVIAVLLLCMIVMFVRFSKVRPAAAYINIPYLLWVIFAYYLNIGVWLLNTNPHLTGR
ncbi:MAG: TspO/MBR family protein [Huintestinicola sp.]